MDQSILALIISYWSEYIQPSFLLLSEYLNEALCWNRFLPCAVPVGFCSRYCSIWEADHFNPLHSQAVDCLRNIFFHPGILSSERFDDAAGAAAVEKPGCARLPGGGPAGMLLTEWPRGGPSARAVWRNRPEGRGGFWRDLKSVALVIIFRRTCSSKNSSNQMRYTLYHSRRGAFSVILTQRLNKGHWIIQKYMVSRQAHFHFYLSFFKVRNDSHAIFQTDGCWAVPKAFSWTSRLAPIRTPTVTQGVELSLPRMTTESRENLSEMMTSGCWFLHLQLN